VSSREAGRRRAPRTRAEQRAERRRAIIDAALRIIASRGLPAVTHRTVAREAGVPLAATTYYFASKNEILSEALESLAAVEVERLEALTATVTAATASRADLAAALGEALIPDPAEAERTWLAQFEIYVEAARNPALRPAVIRWREAFVDLAASALRAIGAPEPERRAPIAVAAINGILLDRLRGVGTDPEGTMADHLDALFVLLLAE
jgi:TetR/AcrR family transcriptional regulator, regulator of biofilm formation and stress response